MGIGMIIVCSSQYVDKIMVALPEGKIIGKVVKTNRTERIRLK
jgi:phosphoribosylaminoimidazole (AIR) synthetase